jgi:hypothetical protein
VAAHPLQLEHQAAERRLADEGTFALMADPPVLTLDAKQVAPAEEDSARAELAHQRPFFTKMRLSGRHFHTDEDSQMPSSPFRRFTPHFRGQRRQFRKIA